jgi:hypothetical protein
LTAAGQGGQLVVVDAPFRPSRPIAGGRRKIAMVGVVGSLVLGILVLGMFAAFDDRLYAERDIESILDGGIVVVVPSVPRRLTAKPVAESMGGGAGGGDPKAADGKDDGRASG